MKKKTEVAGEGLPWETAWVQPIFPTEKTVAHAPQT